MERAKYYASSVLIGRKSKGCFFGLNYVNRSKYYLLRIHVVCWQTWLIEIYDDTSEKLLDSFYVHQREENTPTIELRNSRVYKHGYNYKFKNADISA